MSEKAAKRLRTCIGCGRQSDKMKLARIVRTSDGRIEFDASGRVAGRGAYVCSLECLEKAFATRKLQRALKTTVSKDDADRIMSEAAAALNANARVEE